MAQAADGGVGMQPDPRAIALCGDGGVEAQPGASLPQAFKVEVLARAAGADHPLVVFRGNLLFSDFVYRSLLDLPSDARATPAAARAAAKRLRMFLRSAGYDLSTVAAHVLADQIVVEIDEGQLDKVVIFGSGILETVRFKMELFLPAGVFDRLRLEQQLSELARRYHLNHYSYELVAVEAQPASEPLLEILEGLEPVLGLPGFRPGQRYELHILIASSQWSRGFSPEVKIQAPEGLGLGGSFRAQGLIFDADRLEALARVAGNIRSHLDGPGSRVMFTRAVGEARWISPPLVAQTLRPALTIRGDFLSLQRADVALENFQLASFGASADISWAPLPQLTMTAGAGIERRFLFGLEKAAGAGAWLDAVPKAQTRLYAEVLVDAVFNPRELRTDRKNELAVEARWYPGLRSSGAALWLRGQYQHRIPFGWHELWVRAAGTYMAGQVLFPDEESIGDGLHGAFGNDTFTRALVGVGAEFRFSLVRDAVKLGLFYDQVVFGAIDRSGGPVRSETAGAGGPSMYVLLADEFDTGLYFAFGWTPHGGFSFAPSLYLRQVF